MLLRGSVSLAKRGRAEELMLACEPILHIIFLFLLLFVGLDGIIFLHKRKGGVTHYAHMFALRDCWDRHER